MYPLSGSVLTGIHSTLGDARDPPLPLVDCKAEGAEPKQGSPQVAQDLSIISCRTAEDLRLPPGQRAKGGGEAQKRGDAF